MNAVLERRARQVRARAEIRKWEYRQRKHAKGVWFRLRCVLADAAAAYGIDADDAARLLDEGFVPEPVGAELQPEKRLLFISEERLQSIPGSRCDWGLS